MDNTSSCHVFRHLTVFSQPFHLVLVFILFGTVKLVAPRSLGWQCSLNLDLSPSLNRSSCELVNWGGFSEKKCCGEAFDWYIYALAARANQIGKDVQIFLSPEEQNSCLTSLKRFKGNVLGCGIEKLTKGGGGCSDYTVADVVAKLGVYFSPLSESCNFRSSVGDWDQTCASCIKTWEDMRMMHAVGTEGNSAAEEMDTCRFSFLVALTTTRIEDKAYVPGIFRCLGEQNGSPETQVKMEEKGKHNPRTGTWILFSIPIGFAMMIILAIAVRSRRHHKPNTVTKPKEDGKPKKDAFKDVLLKEPGCQRVSIKEVYTATNNLHELNFVGQGIAGRVYKGILSNNQHVAVKHIISDVNVETVVREVTSLSHIRHPNLVSLLGCCVNEDECFLVYELCPNGNLSEWLFGKEKALPWIQRLSIAIDSAKALHFLHTYEEGCIVHRDIKPTNILLGPNFEARLSDFGLSKVIDLGETWVSSEVRGTFGYLDPEYQNNRQVNSSGDVYSFGIVLLQILSGKKVVNLNHKKPMSLDKIARSHKRRGSISDFADPKLGGEYPAQAFDITLQLALSCTAHKPERPSMEHIVVKLEEALEISTKAKASSPETTPEWYSAESTTDFQHD